MGLEGMTTSKVKIEMNEFFRIVDNVSKHAGRNQLIVANWMLHHGKMLYYKNSPIGTIDNGVNSDNNYPIWLYEKRNDLEILFPKDAPNNNRRQPILAYKNYIMGLDEVMKSKNYFIEL